MQKAFLIVLSLFCFSVSEAQEVFLRTLGLMGSRFDITVVANNSDEGNEYIDIAIGEIKRIEALISSWSADSQTAEINRNAGIAPVKVAPELFGLIKRALAISRLTDGAFDISYASMDAIWKFDGSMTEFPTPEQVKLASAKIGYQNIILDEVEQTVYLKLSGMKIAFGAIGKGFAADKAKALLQEKGAVAGIINASGDMNTWGTQPNGEPWKVAITNPMDKHKAFGLLPITNGAVVTSGDYEKFVVFDGKKYSHIIDPRTGYPTHGIVSATVFAPKAELADALATSVFVLGTEIALDRINQIPAVECIIIEENGDVRTSNNININKQ